MKLIYEGKAKKLYETPAGDLIMEFKDSLTAFNALKKGSFHGKGALNLKFSMKIFEVLSRHQVAHHFLERLNEYQVRVLKLKMWPVEVVVRNRMAGSLAKKLGRSEGEILSEPLVEFYLKDDVLGDPILTENQLRVLKIITTSQINKATEIALQINRVLVPYFAEKKVDLVDFKIELGENRAGDVFLADEISPDSCRLWDQDTGQKLDKDVFRRDLGSVEEAYQEIAKRLGLN
ncbi:MAG: phosphoribosylaminoimidazolesuccinocarboxamide synthase [Bdellovibrionales bacterium]